MNVPEIVLAVRLAVLGALGFAALEELWHARARRDDPVHGAAAAWFGLTALFVAAGILRSVDLAPRLLGAMVRAHYALGLATIPLGLVLVRRTADAPLVRGRLVLAVAIGFALSPFVGDAVFGGTLVERTDALGVRFATLSHGPLQIALIPWLAAVGAYVFRFLGRSPGADPARRRLVLLSVGLLGPAAAWDALVDGGHVPGFKVVELALAAQVVLFSRFLARRSGAVFLSLEQAVAARLEEIKAGKGVARQALVGVKSLLDALPDAVLVHSDARIRYANRAAGAQLGFDPDELVGRTMTDLFPSDRADVALVAAIRAERSAEPLEMREETIVRSDGRQIVCEITGRAFRFEGTPAALETLRDVTELREIEVQLLRADRLASVGTLAAGVSHEINNPLTYVVANVHEVLRRIEKRGETAALAGPAAELRYAAAAADRIRRTVAELQTFARIDEPEDAPVKLRNIIKNTLSMKAVEIERRAQVVRDLGPVPDVTGGSVRVAQLVLGLIVHATRAIPDGESDRHRIRVSTFADSRGDAVIEVATSGPGVMPQDVDAPDVGDRGIETARGLPLSRSLVRAMGGRISFSEGGTIVRVVLPQGESRPSDV